MSTILYKPGEVILIPFPFTDLTTIKYRPTAVISSSDFNRAHDDVIVVAITSNFPENPRPDEKDTYVLNEADQKLAGLVYPSIVKIGKIVTIDKRLVRKHIGTLSEKTTKLIIRKIIGIISIG